MEFKIIKNDLFDDIKGMRMDNSYDPYVLSQAYQYYRENDLKYIESQDNDLSFLEKFPDLEFLLIPVEAYHFEKLNSLLHLKGLILSSNNLSMIDKKILNQLEILSIACNTRDDIDFTQFSHLKKLRVISFCEEEININHSHIESIEIVYSKQLKKINVTENTTHLKKIVLDYLPKLYELNAPFLQINYFSICDCNQISNLIPMIKRMVNLETLILISEEKSSLAIESVNFLDELKKLKYFMTSHRINDGNLIPLLRLKDASILKFYRNYNIADKDLPHEYVIVNRHGNSQYVKLADLEKSKDDPSIIWYD